MNNKFLSFKQKIELYKDMIKYFKNIESSEPYGIEVDDIIVRLKKWGRELKVRENYYDVQLTFKLRKKYCHNCKLDFNILYRVQLNQKKIWVFICESCLNILKPLNKFYKYGGTWKK